MTRRPWSTSQTESAAGRDDGSPPAQRTFGGKDWLFAAALAIAVFLAYQPVWHGALLWDDDAHITAPGLRSWHGLYRIWFDVSATQQYYPLTETGYWAQYKLWGEAVLGYHLVSILLHAAAGVMVAMVLRRLAIPGALLAAAIFALHPVQVESVAWITEQKNTLSAVFYLAAAMAYLRFDRDRGAAWYLAATVLFVLSFASKIVTVTLPAALLIVFWWQRGRLSWRRDVLPLAPWFAISIAAGLFLTGLERSHVGAVGRDFELSVLQRCLLPGRVIWFYLGKLFWPANLAFLYPRWQIDPGAWWQYLFPLALLALLALLWGLRRRWRGPLAGLLFFVGTLFPVLGFLNVYWFTFSYVADHFQYLASLGIISLASAGAALAMSRWRLWNRPAGSAACLVLLAILAGLTWRQCGMYTDIDTLYRTAIERNPVCWMAHNNLAIALVTRGQNDDAVSHYRKAIEIKPDYVNAYVNLGSALTDLGQPDEAIRVFQKALEVDPGSTDAHYNLAIALAACGRIEEAVAHYQKGVEVKPAEAEAFHNLSFDVAIDHLQRALKIAPDKALAYSGFGDALAARGRLDEAIAHFQKAVELQPDDAGARGKLGLVESRREALLRTLAQRRQSLCSQPDDVTLLSDVAWTLATTPNASIRDGTQAVELAQRAVKLTGGRDPNVLGTLAAAYAEQGRVSDAVRAAEQALALATGQNNSALAETLHSQLRQYEAGFAYRDPQPPPVPQSSGP